MSLCSQSNVTLIFNHIFNEISQRKEKKHTQEFSEEFGATEKVSTLNPGLMKIVYAH